MIILLFSLVVINFRLKKGCQKFLPMCELSMRTATWNVSSMVGRSGEVVDALHRRKIYFRCAQETKW